METDGSEGVRLQWVLSPRLLMVITDDNS